MPRIHFDPTEAVQFEIVDPGTYPMGITAVSDVEQGPKAKYITIEFTHASADHKGKVWRNYPIEGKGAGFFMDLWKKVTGETIDQESMSEIDTDDLISQEVTVELGHQEENKEEGWPEKNTVDKIIG